jgi:hypothetical protein
MGYREPLSGRIEPNGSDGGSLLSFAEVEERLIEAMLTCWRHPDRERAWLRVKALWPDVQAEPGDHDARGGDMTSSDVKLRPLSATRRDIGEMEEAFGWVDGASPAERKVISMAISARASGNTRVSWLALASSDGRPDPALSGSADKLRMMYSRGMAKVMKRANRGR